jgi:hypothetical protein
LWAIAETGEPEVIVALLKAAGFGYSGLGLEVGIGKVDRLFRVRHQMVVHNTASLSILTRPHWFYVASG